MPRPVANDSLFGWKLERFNLNVDASQLLLLFCADKR